MLRKSKAAIAFATVSRRIASRSVPEPLWDRQRLAVCLSTDCSAKRQNLGYGRATGTLTRWFRKPARIVRQAGKPPAVVLSQSAFPVEASTVQIDGGRRPPMIGPIKRYHPERHYMRGPGPKWREKHGGTRTKRPQR